MGKYFQSMEPSLDTIPPAEHLAPELQPSTKEPAAPPDSVAQALLAIKSTLRNHTGSLDAITQIIDRLSTGLGNLSRKVNRLPETEI
jgi:hypothetical protein